MVRTAALALVVFASTAAAQMTTTMETNNPAPKKGHPDEIVCEKVVKLGTRLGAKKVCMTVREWQERGSQDRELTEKIQSGTCVPLAGC